MSVGVHPEWSGHAELRRLKTLYELLRALNRSHTLEDVYQIATDTLLRATSADRAAVLTYDDRGVMRFVAARHLSLEYQRAVTGHSPWPKGARDAAPIVVPDVLQEPSLVAYREVFERERIRALAFIPLVREAGLFGKFMLYHSEPREFSTDEVEIAQAIATHIGLAFERAASEAARRRMEQQLTAILDNSGALIYLKDHEGRYVLVNRRYEEVFQMERDRVLGRTDEELFPAELAKRYRANDHRVMEAGQAISMEESALHADGLHNYVSVKFPLEGVRGEPMGVCGISTDITELRRLEIAGQHLAAIVESSDDAIVSKDLNGIITSWNKGAERLFGYTEEEAVGQPISMLAVENGPAEFPDILSQIRSGERVEHYETRRRTKDGRVIDVALTVSPVRNQAGQIIGASKIARDISDRKLAEQERAELLQREQQARRTAELLNRLSPRLAGQLHLQTLVQEITDIATDLVGAEFGSFFHNVLNEKGESYMLYTLSGVPREAFSKFPMPRNTAVFSPTFSGEGIVRSDDITKDPRYGNNPPYNGMPQGHLPVCSYLAAPVVSRSGEVIGGLFFGHSLPGRFTEGHEVLLAGIAAQAAIAMDNARLFEQSKRAQNALKRSNEELRRSNEDLETFAYSASHDLQEPLRTMGISAQLLDMHLGKELQGDPATFLSNILVSTKRMNTLLQDLLAYTRATKYAEGPAQAVDAAAVLSSVLEGMQASIEETRASATLPVVPIHEGRLAQLFQNLISNAIKYSKQTPKVHVSAEERDGFCVFSVSDNGIGIEPQFKHRIFGLFKRLHSHDQYPGSGIGLAICQRILDHYGGRIWLERSVPGEGSTFCFSIPTKDQ